MSNPPRQPGRSGSSASSGFSRRRARPAAAAALIAVLLAAGAREARADSENDWFVPLGPPPKAAPKRISGGESMPPLPLPATPLRRSERKKEPAAPKLIGKVVWGETASFTYDGGGAAEVSDWNLCPGDLQSLMAKGSRLLGTSYGADTINLATFNGDPEQLPVLFISGTRTLRLSAEQFAGLRAYVLRGGMVVFDSVAGSPYFYESVKTALATAFPNDRLRTIPADHPIYHIATDVDKVRYPRNNPSTKPALEGLYIGCRVGVLVSKYGLGCGWDERDVPLLPQAVYYDVDSAVRIGVNLVAYAIGYSHVGVEEAKPELFGAADEKAPTDEFVFAQLVHEGAWNVHPGAAAALLRQVNHDLAVRASLKRVAVDPARDDLAAFHFLYLTGLDDFVLGEKAAGALRRFVDSGGTLLISNGLGLKTFDAAVRRELAKVFPEVHLQAIPPDHALFNSVFHLDAVRYTAAVLAANPKLTSPALEGIQVGGDLRVIYSPYDLEAGWSGCEHPLARAYDSDSALKLGMDLVMYAVTH
jgi:hypothetical protein